MAAQARAFFKEGRYFQAAQAFAQCSVTFEEVTLKFLDVGQRDALRSYLISRLERTKRSVSANMNLPFTDILVNRAMTGFITTNDAGNLAGRVLSQQM